MTETTLAFDFGGTWIRVAEVNQVGTIVWSERVRASGSYAQDLASAIELSRARSDQVSRIGISCPGPFDYKTGEVIRAANLNWEHEFPARDLSDRLGLSACIDNDADCAALGEWRFGAGCGVDHLVYYGIGTGVGTGVVQNGYILHGQFDTEFGHQIIEPLSKHVCTAGHPGCLEALISGGRLEAIFGSIETVPPDWWANVIPAYLGQALMNTALFLSPEVIIVGGGVTDHQPDIVARAESEMIKRMRSYVPVPRILPSKLGADIGIIGAAALALK